MPIPNTKPTDLVLFAELAPAGRAVDPSTVRSEGYPFGAPLPSNQANYLFRALGRYAAWVAAGFDADGKLTTGATHATLEVTNDNVIASEWAFGGGGDVVNMLGLKAGNYAWRDEGLPIISIESNGELLAADNDGTVVRLDLIHTGSGFSAIAADRIEARERVDIGGFLNAGTGFTEALDLPFDTELSLFSIDDGSASYTLFTFRGGSIERVMQMDCFRPLISEPPLGLKHAEVQTTKNLVAMKLVLEVTVPASGPITSGDISVLKEYNFRSSAGVGISGSQVNFVIDDASFDRDRHIEVSYSPTLSSSDIASEIFHTRNIGCTVAGDARFVPLIWDQGTTSWVSFINATGLTPGDKLRMTVAII